MQPIFPGSLHSRPCSVWSCLCLWKPRGVVLGVGHRTVAGQAWTLSLEHRGAQGGAVRQTDTAPYHLPGNKTIPRGGQVGVRGQSPGSAGQGGRSLSPVMGAGLWAGEMGTCSLPALMEAVRSVPLPASLEGLVLPCEMGSGPSQCWVCSGHSSGCFPGLKCARRHTDTHTDTHASHAVSWANRQPVGC